MSVQSQYVIGLYCDGNPTKNRCRHNIACPLGGDESANCVYSENNSFVLIRSQIT